MIRISRALLAASLAAGLGLPKAASAQDAVVNDTEWRLLATAQKRVFDGFRVFVSPEMRSEEVEPNRFLVEVGARYKFNDYFSMRTAYRLGLEQKRDVEETQHRYRLDAVGKYEIGDFTPALRWRYQGSFGPDADARHRFRYRAQLGYAPWKRWEFAASIEPWQDIETGDFKKIRYGAGVEWVFFKKKYDWTKLSQSVAFDYRLDYDIDDPLNVHIFRLGYGILF